jgi:hypothetical protein
MFFMFERKGSMFLRVGGSEKRGVWVGWVCVVWSETNIKNIKHIKTIERQRFACYVCFMFWVMFLCEQNIKPYPTHWIGFCACGFHIAMRVPYSVRCGCQTNQARVWSILQPKVWLWCGGWVRCGYILHPSFSLVLGLVLRERIKSKK